MATLFNVISTKVIKGLNLIKVRAGTKWTRTPAQASTMGFASKPVKNAVAVLIETESSEDPVVVGYLDINAINDQLSDGERGIYSQDKDGNVTGTLIMRTNGTCEILGNGDNAVRFSVLNQEIVKLKAEITALVTAYNTHVHPVPAAAALLPPPAPTPATSPTPATGTPPTIDISLAKIEEIKVPK